ncbi:Peptidase M16 inactive domain [Trypanosoma vivax]|uniref:Putative mitochondrial processing peptidase alpha subunit n=1 Tax=Trypanosoma vivax (strain Y486) TaxID=1055687 RepID=G0UAU9_TRYVY|nr:putative processing peptidase alpha subunit [Trypanosoma vivax]KAH8611257.1 Peptidase M16 inactive domain [Trypanosoma vivax]CCC52936.1 putative mitochondrial processing peptidase alpha subunit [Trypanosoma vivax Y486]
MHRCVHPTAVCDIPYVRSIAQYKFGQTPLTQQWSSARGTSGRLTPSAPLDTIAPAPKTQKVEVTLLANGTRLITQQLGGPMVSIGAYALAGPVYDPVGCPGLHNLLHLALTTSNYNSSLFQLDRGIRSTGAALSHFEKGKYYIGIRLDSRIDMWKNFSNNGAGTVKQFQLSLVQDTIFTALSAPRFHEADIERFRDTIDNNLSELRWQQPCLYAIQMLETVAFYKEPLGNPRHLPECSNDRCTNEALLEQYARFITPDRVVIAGVNVDHDELLAEYESTPFPHSASAPHHAAFEEQRNSLLTNVNKENLQYSGGQLHQHEDRPKVMGTKPDMNTETIVAVGFLAFGRSRTSLQRYAATLVFQQLFNMTIQDGVRYDQRGALDGLRSFYLPYQSAGLIGFTAVAERDKIVQLVTFGARSLREPNLDNQVMLDVAKHRAVVDAVSRQWDSVRDICDYLGTSLPFDIKSESSTQHLTLKEILEAIQHVDAAGLNEVKASVQNSQPSLFGHGEMLAFPSLKQLGLWSQ